MNLKLCSTTAALMLLATAAFAQQIELPAPCRNLAQGAHDPAMKDMMSKMEAQMKDMQAKMGDMTETQKGLHDAMKRMHGPMMEGMMAKDADVAWICAMIPHHQAAIGMAEAGLKGTDNAESRRMAEETIAGQKKEISKLTAWVNKNASRESGNEKADMKGK